MEKQKVVITVKTEGDKCEMTDKEIVDWYLEKINGLFSKDYGTPVISVELKREEE